jgi:pSer/pThr/pTyr-binding forkhead associated (FHA) protein
MDARACPLDKFDALFGKITQERRVADGYFVHAHPGETQLLFIVNGAPYGAGRLAADVFSFTEIHEFFAAFSRHPQSPLSFFVADKRLLLGLMVLFHHRPALQFTTDLVDMEEVLKKLAARGADAIVSIRAGEEWALSICTKGKPVANYFPPSGADALKEPTPGEQLLVYVFTRPPGGVTVDVYEETRITPAGDASLLTPEMRGRISEVFMKVAAKVAEEEKEEAEEEAPRLEMETAAEAAIPGMVEEEPAAAAASPSVTEITGQVSVPPMPSVAPTPKPAAESAAVPPSKGPVPELHLFLGEKQLGTFPLTKAELTIGRNPGNDILIDNVGVSRRHAAIQKSGDRVTVEDLGSANGTFVNGQKITKHELQDGDEILVLKHRLVFHVPKEATPPPKAAVTADAGQKTMFIDPGMIAQAAGKAPAAKPEAAGPKLRPRLILPDLKKTLALEEEEEVALGSGAECKIQVSGMFVAKLHAKIVREKEGQFKIVHVAGLAGTRVNGEKITEHVLKHGDKIEIGKQKLLFRLER